MNLIKEVGFAPSTSEAKRLIQGGAVSFAGNKISDFKAQLAPKGGEILQVGKLKVCKLKIQ